MNSIQIYFGWVIGLFKTHDKNGNFRYTSELSIGNLRVRNNIDLLKNMPSSYE